MEITLLWWFSALAAFFVFMGIYFRNLPTAAVSATLLVLIGVSLLTSGVDIANGNSYVETISALANTTNSTTTTLYSNTKNDYTNGVGLLSIVFSFYMVFAFLLPREEGENEVSN